MLSAFLKVPAEILSPYAITQGLNNKSSSVVVNQIYGLIERCTLFNPKGTGNPEEGRLLVDIYSTLSSLKLAIKSEINCTIPNVFSEKNPAPFQKLIDTSQSHLETSIEHFSQVLRGWKQVRITGLQAMKETHGFDMEVPTESEAQENLVDRFMSDAKEVRDINNLTILVGHEAALKESEKGAEAYNAKKEMLISKGKDVSKMPDFQGIKMGRGI